MRMPSPRTRRWIRRAALGAAFLGAMYALGHQIKTRYPKTQKNRPIVERVEPAARTRPAERRIERPAFVENFLRRNMNAGTIQEVENRWSGVAREALQYYQTRPGPRFIPAPDPEVNAA